MQKKSASLSKVPVKSNKSTYENSKHEEKHKQFMRKVTKLGAKGEQKTDKPVLKASDAKKRSQKLSKSKPAVQPPSFKDLMALAEKGAKDPSILQKNTTKLQSPIPDSPGNAKELKLQKPKLPSSVNSNSQHSSLQGKKNMSTTKPPQKGDKCGETGKKSSHAEAKLKPDKTAKPSNTSESRPNNSGTQSKGSSSQQRPQNGSKRPAQPPSNSAPPAKKALSGNSAYPVPLQDCYGIGDLTLGVITF